MSTHIFTKPRRIFWLGMHKVLKPTELRLLRGMGYEVFNPAYISPVYDQSADLTIDLDQPSTLPPDVFKTLIEYDFFYRPIDQNIADLLNEHFDVAIVTINAHWLIALMRAFQGPTIYRTYGQHQSLSEDIIREGAWEMIISRENFAIVPFAQETVENEHRWFLELCTEAVPYQIPDDVFGEAHWTYEERRAEVAVSLPNIQNPYFGAAYERFTARFQESYFRLYGPQRSHPEDARIVGALPRSEFLQRLRQSSAYYYDYRDRVAYLPPIEMMEMRGPTVCAKGSLLARFLQGTPNVATDDEDAREKLNRLVRGDKHLSAELIAAQEETRRRYDRTIVQPTFERVFGDLLSARVDRAALASITGPIIQNPTCSAPREKIAVALHADGLFAHKEGRAYAFEGIPRVVDAIVKTVGRSPGVSCEIACTRNAAPVLFDFFEAERKRGTVDLHVINMPKGRDAPDALAARMKWLDHVETDPTVSTALAPHYYLFPELLLTTKRLALYLPDYFPHLAPNEVFDETPERDARNKRVGVALAEKADRILTNSHFTRRYLPDAGFTRSEDDPKVVVAPLPFLGINRAVALTEDEEALVAGHLCGRPFLFYPTANRPNKNLVLLLEAFAEVRFNRPELGLALTCDLNVYPAVAMKVQELELHDHIHLFPRASEGLLRWLYKNSVALTLSSVLEGNFPPQILEALNYETPVVATALPTIVEILGKEADQLLLFQTNDRAGLISGIEKAITQREAVLAAQAQVAVQMRERNSSEAFERQLRLVFPELMTSSGDT